MINEIDITKQNFMYCLRAKEGKGCLCAAMFYMYEEIDNNKIRIEFKSLYDSYSQGVRAKWKVPTADNNALNGFYLTHRLTNDFVEKNIPNAKWWQYGHEFNDKDMIVHVPNWKNKSAPNGLDEIFWIKQFEITKEMFDNGILNGNYPQGHYQMKDDQMVLLLSYFAELRGNKLRPEFCESLLSCHKLSDSNLKKNWFVKNVVLEKGVLENIDSEDFWRLTLASQLYNGGYAKDNYIKKFLNLLGPSSIKEWRQYVNAILSNDFKQYEVDEGEVLRTSVRI